MSEEFNDLQENADIYTLVDEDGVEQDFEMIDQMEENGVVYYALVPYFEDPTKSIEGDTELVVLKAETGEDGEDILATIDDDDEYERIGNIFLDRIQEMFDEEEDDGE